MATIEREEPTDGTDSGGGRFPTQPLVPDARAGVVTRRHPAVVRVVPVCALVAMAWLLIGRLPGGDSRLALGNLLQIGGAVAASVVAGRAARRADGRSRRHLRLLSLAAGAWSAGQASWTLGEVVLDRPVPFPSVGDVGFLLTYPFLFAALAAVPATRLHRTSLVRSGIDALSIGLSLFFVSWALVLPDVLAPHSTFEEILALAYPVGDVLVVLIALLVLTRVTGAWRDPVALVAVGVGLLGIADIGFILLHQTDGHATGSSVDLGWVLAWPVVAVAATAVPRSERPRGAALEPPGRVAAAVPPSALLAVIGTVVGREMAGDPAFADPVLLWVAIGLALVTVAGALAAHAEGRSLLSAMSDQNRERAALAMRYQMAIEAAGIGTWTSASDGGVTLSPVAERLVGLEPGRLPPGFRGVRGFVEPADHSVVAEALDAMVNGDDPVDFEFRARQPDGSLRWVQARGRRALGEDGEVIGAEGVVFCVTDRHEARRLAEERAAQAEALAALGRRTIAQGLSGGMEDAARTLVTTLDADMAYVLELDAGRGVLRLARNAGTDVTVPGTVIMRADPESLGGYTLDASLPVMVDAADAESRFDVPRRLVAAGVRTCVSASIARGDGNWGVLLVARRRAERFTMADGAFVQAVAATVGAAAERAQTEDALRHETLHDPLTGLANRSLLHDWLDHALAAGRGATLFCLDLDGFKSVNAEHGHQAGDAVLREVARRLAEFSGGRGDTVARMGADAFAVLVDEALTAEGSAAVAESLGTAAAAPVETPAGMVTCTASIGSASAAGRSGDGGDLLRDAGLALDTAKTRGRGCWAHFEERMHDDAVRRWRTKSGLAEAILRDELVMHYQPVVDLRTGTVSGVEALVRWAHPGDGLLLPAEFVPAAEAAGLMPAVTGWVLGEACRWAASRADPTRSPITVAVNISPSELVDSRITDRVARALADSGLDPARLCVEITETALVEDVEAAVAPLLALQSLGVRLAVDDFGTGYSSLAHLNRLPIDIVKIDKSFVDGLGRELEDTAMVAAVVQLAHRLSLAVVAEGVESEAQLRALRHMDCEYAQGYLLGRPAGPRVPLPHHAVADLTDRLLLRAEREAGTPPVRVVVVDDLEHDRRLLRRALERSPRFTVVGEAGDGEQAVERVAALVPDLVLLDLNMPAMDGLTALPRVRAAAPLARVVVLTGYASDEVVTRALASGALGVLLKDDPDVVGALEAVLGPTAGTAANTRH